MPERIQRKRTKGWGMPEGAVYVGRPSKWGNPFVAKWQPYFGEWWVLRGDSELPFADSSPEGRELALWRAVAEYRWQVAPALPVDELRGRDLACWCPLDQPCHADVLLQLANRDTFKPQESA